MTAEQSIRNIEREADEFNRGKRNVENIFAAITPALATEPPFKTAGKEYVDHTGKIPAGHARILHWVRPYDDEAIEYSGPVVAESAEFITISLGSKQEFTAIKARVIITRSAQ